MQQRRARAVGCTAARRTANDSTAYTARHSSQADRARHPASGPAVWPWRVGLTMSANAVETVLAVLDALDFRRLDAIVQM